MKKFENDNEMARQIVQAFVWYTNNVNYGEFMRVLPDILDLPAATDDYLEKHWNSMREDPATWFAELDENAQRNLMSYVIEKYLK